MAEKRKIANKAQKVKPVKKDIDWNSLPELVIVIGEDNKHLEKGKEYRISKYTAKVLVDKGAAKLK